METLVLVVAILAVGAITPGPNNFMVMTAGARGGLSAAAPVIGGVVLGGLVLLVLAWSGVAAALEAAPGVRVALTCAGAGYLAWLGGGMIWRARRRGRSSDGRPPGVGERSQTWLGVAAFQLLNPKAWALLVTAAAAMSHTFDGLSGLAALAVIYAARSALSLTIWAIAGSSIAGLLSEGGSKLWFDRSMGGLLVALALFLVGDV